MRLIILLIVPLLIQCTPAEKDAQDIVDKAIEVHGGEKFKNSVIEFDFRERHYIARRNKGKFSYERIFLENADTIHDYLTNDGFSRKINGAAVDVADSMAVKYTRSVNSTIYFASLPYGLNDDAVRKKLLGETVIQGKPYYKVEVTFAQEGGGEDFNDVFHYWFHKENFTMDYLAYRYYTEEGGIRFRSVLKQHEVNGFLLQDYINYKPKHSNVQLQDVEELFKRNELEELSRIEIKNVKVELLE